MADTDMGKYEEALVHYQKALKVFLAVHVVVSLGGRLLGYGGAGLCAANSAAGAGA